MRQAMADPQLESMYQGHTADLVEAFTMMIDTLYMTLPITDLTPVAAFIATNQAFFTFGLLMYQEGQKNPHTPEDTQHG